MPEKWKNTVDEGKCFGVLLTDLSKAVDSLSQELLKAKLHAYGFDLPALKRIQSYLSNTKKGLKLISTYSSRDDISFGVPQKPILGPLLFNIFCVMFRIMCETDFASYADDNTPFVL